MTRLAQSRANAETDSTTRLQDLAFNLWWTWHPEVIELFRDLDPELWRETNHNPLALLRRLGEDEVNARVVAHSLEARVTFHHRRMQEYLLAPATWCARDAPPLEAAPQAYFSAEFGLHECLPLYSGGLGVLAGDFVTSASDLGLPVVGVGLYYALGYFRQRLDESGWQREDYDTTLVVHQDPNVQQERDSVALYELLERTVVPAFYDRDAGVPTRWVRRMKRAIRTLAWRFNADRMVIDYARGCYAPAAGVQSNHCFHV